MKSLLKLLTPWRLLLLAVITATAGCDSTETASARPLAGDIAFTGINIIDLESGALVTDQLVLIENQRIKYIGPALEAQLGDAVTRIDGRGKYLVPGLSEMHGHPVGKEDLLLHLANGITTLRAMWGEPSLLQLRQQARKGDFPAPRLHIAGPIVDGAPPMHFGTIGINDPIQADLVVQRHVDEGYDFIKLYEGITLPVFDALTKAAAAKDIEIAGHVPIAVPLSHAAESGMRSTEHMFGYLLQTESDPEGFDIDRWYYLPDHKARLEAIGRGDVALEDVISEDRLSDMVETLASSAIWTTPTLQVLRGGLGRTDFDQAQLRYLRPAVGYYWGLMMPAAREAQSDDYIAGFNKVYPLYLQFLKRLHDAGAGILVGTDAANPGVVSAFAVVDEMENLLSAGFSRLDVLRMAMREPARYLDMEDQFGLVKEGHIADLIMLDGDPREDFSVLRRPTGVMRQGTWLDRSDLDRMLMSVEETYASWMAPFEDMPELPGAGIANAWLYTESGAHLAMATIEDTTDAEFRGEEDDVWRSLRLARTESGIVLTRMLNETSQEVETQVADTKTQLIADGEVIDTFPEAALVLSATPVDIPLLADELTAIDVGDKTTIAAWLCPPNMQCTDAPVRWKVTRLADDAPEGHYYFTGSRVFHLDATDNAHDMTIWIGGGGYEGQPVQARYADGVLWRRRK